MKFLDNNTPQVDFGNIHAFIISVMSINKEELVKVNDCGPIGANNTAANNFYIV